MIIVIIDYTTISIPSFVKSVNELGKKLRIGSSGFWVQDLENNAVSVA